jgi:integrase/recombinase XerD
MSNSVAPLREETDAMPPRARTQEFSLYSPTGARKYLNRDERLRALAEMAKLPTDRALFCLTLAWTGARVSEVLALKASSFQVERGIVAIQTLKRRKHHVREVPIPPDLIAALEEHFHLSAKQRDPLRADSRLWPWHRVTAWRVIKLLMARSGVRGQQASPKGFRHGFGHGSLQSGVPITLLKRWLGHARITTTEIYADACGPDEREFARKFWTL